MTKNSTHVTVARKLEKSKSFETGSSKCHCIGTLKCTTYGHGIILSIASCVCLVFNGAFGKACMAINSVIETACRACFAAFYIIISCSVGKYINYYLQYIQRKLWKCWAPKQGV